VFGVGRVLVGTSGSPGSLRALRYGEGLARAHDAVLVPVIVWELPGGDRAYRISGSRELGKACREIAARQLRDALIAVWGEVPGDPLVQPHVERGPVGWVLVSLASRSDDVLVVGAPPPLAPARPAGPPPRPPSAGIPQPPTPRAPRPALPPGGGSRSA